MSGFDLVWQLVQCHEIRKEADRQRELFEERQRNAREQFNQAANKLAPALRNSGAIKFRKDYRDYAIQLRAGEGVTVTELGSTSDLEIEPEPEQVTAQQEADAAFMAAVEMAFTEEEDSDVVAAEIAQEKPVS